MSFRWLVRKDGTKALQYSSRIDNNGNFSNEIKLCWLNVEEIIETVDNNPYENLFYYGPKE